MSMNNSSSPVAKRQRLPSFLLSIISAAPNCIPSAAEASACVRRVQGFAREAEPDFESAPLGGEFALIEVEPVHAASTLSSPAATTNPTAFIHPPFARALRVPLFLKAARITSFHLDSLSDPKLRRGGRHKLTLKFVF